jgi:hypothetical protein
MLQWKAQNVSGNSGLPLAKQDAKAETNDLEVLPHDKTHMIQAHGFLDT